MVKVWVFHEAVVPPTDRGVNTKPKDRERVAPEYSDGPPTGDHHPSSYDSCDTRKKCPVLVSVHFIADCSLRQPMAPPCGTWAESSIGLPSPTVPGL
jgi:hypothetical protein